MSKHQSNVHVVHNVQDVLDERELSLNTDTLRLKKDFAANRTIRDQGIGLIVACQTTCLDPGLLQIVVWHIYR